MKKELSTNEFIKIILAICDNVEKEKDYLSELDRATGDGDHGVTMSIGWSAVKEKISTLEDNFTFDKICMQIASSFLSAVGASAGPLYATALMRGGAKLKDLTVINSSQLSEFFDAAANGIQDRGKANLGDKTMLDVWLPTAKKITYIIDLKRVIMRRLVMGIADAKMEVDGRLIYQATDLKVGLFTRTDNF